jgi:hypothetical protein
MPFLFTVPVGNQLPWYKFRISLSGVLFTLHMRYNTRMTRWILDVNDASDNPIISGIPVLIERNLVGQYATLAIPEGILFASDDTGNGQQPTLYSFGLDHSMWYEDPTQ